MPINSKQKGKRFELELASRLRDYGLCVSRTAQVMGKTGQAADLVGLPGIHIEAKHQEKMMLYDWIDQARRDATASGTGCLPAVFHRKNHCDILVTMRLEDWMTLYLDSKELP